MSADKLAFATVGSIDALETLIGNSNSICDAYQITSDESIDVVAVEMKTITSIEFEHAKVISLSKYCPILIYGIDDLEAVAKLLGVSVAYPHLLVYFATKTTEGTIFPLGTSLRPYNEIGSSCGMLTVSNPAGEKPDADALEDSGPLTIKPARKIRPLLIDEIKAALQHVPIANSAVTEDPPPNWVIHIKWNVVGGNTFVITDPGSQTISIYITWEVEMFGASDTDNDKYLRITTRGPGATPGPLYKDERTDRGYFQDRISITMSALEDQPLTLFDHSPDNINDAETITSDTTFGLSKDGVEASIAKSIEMKISDFDVINLSQPFKAAWDFKLNKIQTQLKSRSFADNIDNIFDIYPMWGASAVCSLPTLSKATLQPNCQSIWTAPPNDSSVRLVICQAEQHVYRAWIKTGWKIEFPWYGYNNFRFDHILADFSKV